jgi:hypothetical protein
VSIAFNYRRSRDEAGLFTGGWIAWFTADVQFYVPVCIAGATLENLQIDVGIKHTIVIRAASADFQYDCVSIRSVLQVVALCGAGLESCTVSCVENLFPGIGHEN